MSTITLENVVISFPDLFKPKQYKGAGDAKYSASFIIKEGVDPSELAKAVKTLLAEDHADRDKSDLKYPFKKGRAVKSGPYKDCLQFNAYSNESHPPTVVDRGLNPVTDPAKIFAGTIVNVEVAVFSFDDGIGVGLRKVQIVNNGPDVVRLDGSKAVDEVFKTLEEAPEPLEANSSGSDDDFLDGL